jgi:hypothetical protein
VRLRLLEEAAQQRLAPCSDVLHFDRAVPQPLRRSTLAVQHALQAVRLALRKQRFALELLPSLQKDRTRKKQPYATQWGRR